MNLLIRSRSAVILTCYVLFTELCFSSRKFDFFDKFLNPYLFFGAAFSVGAIYLLVLAKAEKEEPLNIKGAFSNRGKAAIIGLIAGGICFFSFQNAIKTYPEPVKHSDVLPQLEAQYDWFSSGEFPYQKLHLEKHSPYPVYMPLQWLPIGISRGLGIDARWSGYILLFLICGLTGWILIRKKEPKFYHFLSFLVLGLPLLSFLRNGSIEIPVSYELVIAAYYMLLGLGLVSRNLVLIILGVAACVLSRYTLVFWMPFFALLFLWKEGWKKSFQLWGGVGMIVLLVYIIPFLSKDPTILTRGLTYHNNAAVAEWKGWKDTGVSYTMETGISFAGNMKRYFSGEPADKVFKARVVQASVMLGLFFFGLWLFFRLKNQISIYDFSHVMLYFFVIFFYSFGPLTYHYYWIVPMMSGAVLCLDLINREFSETNSIT